MKSEIVTIRTSDSNWLKNTLKCLKAKAPFTLVDDAGLGITLEDLRTGLLLVSKAEKAGVPWNRIAQALAGIGYCGIGIWVIRMACLDPEPTSKLALLVGGGLLCIFVGGGVVFVALKAPIKVKAHFGEYGFGFGCSF